VAYDLGLTDEPWELPEKSPLAVRNPDVLDSFVETDWDTALNLTAQKMADTVKAYGPDSIMGLTSARCTNEDNYIFQKFMRAAIGTNNLDHCARL
jgi:predicted molibdopterin-dependent oxidoreductase YjgC